MNLYEKAFRKLYKISRKKGLNKKGAVIAGHMPESLSVGVLGYGLSSPGIGLGIAIGHLIYVSTSHYQNHKLNVEKRKVRQLEKKLEQ